MLASGDVADVNLVFHSAEPQILKGGLALPLDDLMAKYGKNYVKLHGPAVEALRKYHSDGTGKLFFWSYACAEKTPMKSEYPIVGMYVRWDLYKELGYPAVTDYDGVLALMKKMQDAHPQTEDGKKVWGFSYWTDWGGFWAWYFPLIVTEGMINFTDYYLMSQDGTMRNPFTDPDSPVWKNVKWLNKAYKMGLLDPDFATQSYANYTDKIHAGQYLMTWVTGQPQDANSYYADNGHPERGFGLLLGPAPYVARSERTSAILGWSERPWIGKDCKVADRVVRLLDFGADYDGSRILHSGIKDLQWDIVDGAPKAKEDVTQLFKTDKYAPWKTGIGPYGYWAGFNVGVKHPKDGVTLDVQKDPRYYQMLPIEKDYVAFHKVKTVGEAMDKFISAGKVKDAFYDYGIGTFMPVVPDNLHAINMKAEQYMTREMSKALFAATDAEFDAQKAKMIAEVKSYGYADAAKWMADNWAKAYAMMQELRAAK